MYVIEMGDEGRIIVEKRTVEKKVDNTEAIKRLVTKEEFAEFKNENFTRLDKTLGILNRLDQERLFTFERVKRIEEEIEKIKTRLAID
jgi:hypothetical protein